MKSVLPVMLFIISTCFFGLNNAVAQYQGPESGTIEGGALVSTEDFTYMTVIGPPQMHNPKKKYRKHEFKLLPNPANIVQPTGPAGSNEVYDPGVNATESDAPIKISGFRGIPDQGTNIPPDPHMAAGPDHLMGVVNSRFGIFDKSGTILKLIEADDWYASVARGADPFDPQVVYDHHSNRWLMIWLEYTENPPKSSILLSISDDADPPGTWCNWRLPGNQNGSTPNTFFPDYPKIGVDEHAVYVSGRMFDIPTGRFQYSQLRIIPKAQLLDNTCGPVTWTDFWDLRDPDNLNNALDTVVPCVTFGSPGSQYFINDSRYITGTFMTLWELIDPVGSAVLIGTNIPVTTCTAPPDADQLGGSTTLIDVGRRCVRNAVYLNGSVWTAQSIAGGTNAAYCFARYVRIDVKTLTAIEDVSFGADGFWYYYPAIHPDANGNMVLVFTRSGLNEYASVRYTGRLATDPAGLQASVLLKAGEANYVKTFGEERNRWGDYNGIALDPVDGSKLWIFAEYAASPQNNWGTWFGAVTYTPVAGRKIQTEPQSYAFDTFEVGQSSETFPVIISNIGAQELTISSITHQSPSFEISGLPELPVTLSSFGEFELGVKFAPVAPGVLVDSIEIHSNDTKTSVTLIHLEGFALGTATFAGVVKDSLLNLPVQATLTFLRKGEINPRAIVTTDATGTYSVDILEGTYDITIVPEIPYPEVRRYNFSHTLAGTEQNLYLLPASLVLVEDDSAGTAMDVYRDILKELGHVFAVWNMNETHSTIPATRLQLVADPAILLWITGATVSDVLSSSDRSVIMQHLDRGGSLILTGENIAETTMLNDTLLAKYLGVEFDTNFSMPLLKGFTDDPIGNGLITGVQGDSKDQLILSAAPPAMVHKVFSYGTLPADTSKIAAVRVHEDNIGWKAVYFGFRLEEVTLRHRTSIIERTINWISDTLQVGIEYKHKMQLPLSYRLEQNYPNPFNPTTTIDYELPKASVVILKVFNLVGQEVATLVHGKRGAGRYSVVFNAGRLAAGVYLYQLSTGDIALTKKFVLLK